MNRGFTPNPFQPVPYQPSGELGPNPSAGTLHKLAAICQNQRRRQTLRCIHPPPGKIFSDEDDPARSINRVPRGCWHFHALNCRSLYAAITDVSVNEP